MKEIKKVLDKISVVGIICVNVKLEGPIYLLNPTSNPTHPRQDI